MTRTTLRIRLLAALVGLVPATLYGVAPAQAAPASKATPTERKVPAAPSEADDARRAAMLAALVPELHEALFAVVADTGKRLRASEHAAAEGTGDLLGVRHAARVALFAVDFGGISKHKKPTVEAVIDLVVLQLGTSLHAELRNGIGRRRAIKAVRKCAGSGACLDAIQPSETMTAAHVSSIRRTFEGNSEELEAEDRLLDFEIQTLTSTYNRSQQALSNVTSKHDKTADGIVQNIRG